MGKVLSYKLESINKPIVACQDIHFTVPSNTGVSSFPVTVAHWALASKLYGI